jgi:hypothetical protein
LRLGALAREKSDSGKRLSLAKTLSRKGFKNKIYPNLAPLRLGEIKSESGGKIFSRKGAKFRINFSFTLRLRAFAG